MFHVERFNILPRRESGQDSQPSPGPRQRPRLPRKGVTGAAAISGRR